jgi:hypothetical protein
MRLAAVVLVPSIAAIGAGLGALVGLGLGALERRRNRR